MTDNFDDIQPAGLTEQPVSEIDSHLDAERKEDIQQTIDKIPQLRAERILDTMKTLLAPIGYLIALVAAFLFVFVFKGTGFESTAIPLIASILGYFGLTSWRTNFDNFETWFKSKTIVGALIVVVPVVAIVVLSLCSVGLPAWVLTLLGALVTAGGGTSIIGVFDAYTKSSSN
jgi:hypothetical protein